MKFRTVNGKIRHAVSPIGQARTETKACGGCGYHVCSCVKVVPASGAGLSAGTGGNGYECQIGKYIFRTDPATGHVFWSHADDA